VAHSLSPKLHGYWLKKYGIEGEYRALAIEPKNLKEAVTSLPQRGWRGCNLTLPHKETVLAFLDFVDEAAKIIGAVNTIIVDANNLLYGSNTDAYGFTENIRPGLSQKNKAVILGAGGAARAVCYALVQLDFAEIILINRTPERAQALAAQSPGKIITRTWGERSALLKNANLLVNTTSLGMTGKEPLDIDLAALPQSALVTDIVYTPLMTPLLKQAQARGNAIIDGLGMLMHQAVPGFEAWFGVRPEVTGELNRHLLNE
jgi:shikimate dehydrogenase